MPHDKPIKLTLFHSESCIHCINFMPTWHEMSADENAKKNIDFEEFEESAIGALPEDIRSINGEDVRSHGYPTLKLSVNGDDYMYVGKRTPEEIYNFILETIKENKDLHEKGVTVNKTDYNSDNDEKFSHIDVSTNKKNVSETSRDMFPNDMFGGGLHKNPLFKRRINDDDFKFMNEVTNFSEVARIK